MSSRLKILFLVLLSLLYPPGCRKTPEPPYPGRVADFAKCIDDGASTSFEIVTLNLGGFPKDGYKSILVARDLIEKTDADVIALQEVTSEASFNSLLSELDGWQGRFYPELNADWNLAWLFKTSEVVIDDSKTRMILTDDYYAFPRAPFEVYLKHKPTGRGAYFINLHLKCCGGSDNEQRRRDAAEKLDAYIKSYRSTDPVVILGDFNDEIDGDSYDSNVFYSFISAPSEYLFTDMDIARGSILWWSYPSWPSHIDHILVTNELFQYIDTVMTLKPDPCYSEYFIELSDHRPVELILK